MAILTNQNGRSSKRRKLSPPEEDQQGVARASKRNVKSATTNEAQNGDVIANTPAAAAGDDHVVAELPSVKDLASSEPALRRAAMKSIINHLETRSPSKPLSLTECLQLWRGFWVAIYMHDSKNALSVQNLLRDIAHTVAIAAAKDDEAQKPGTGDAEASGSETGQRGWLTTYHTAFHQTMVREWAGIDSHRLNKALLTYRFVMRELFQICFSPLFVVSPGTNAEKPKDPVPERKTKKQSSKDATQKPNLATDESSRREAVSGTTSIVRVLETTGPLNPVDRKIPDGLRLHVLDIWNDELFGALEVFTEQTSSNDDDDGRSAVVSRRNGVDAALDALEQPLERMAKSDSGAQRHVRVRAKETLQALKGRREETVDK